MDSSSTPDDSRVAEEKASSSGGLWNRTATSATSVKSILKRSELLKSPSSNKRVDFSMDNEYRSISTCSTAVLSEITLFSDDDDDYMVDKFDDKPDKLTNSTTIVEHKDELLKKFRHFVEKIDDEEGAIVQKRRPRKKVETSCDEKAKDEWDRDVNEDDEIDTSANTQVPFFYDLRDLTFVEFQVIKLLRKSTDKCVFKIMIGEQEGRLHIEKFPSPISSVETEQALLLTAMKAGNAECFGGPIFAAGCRNVNGSNLRYYVQKVYARMPLRKLMKKLRDQSGIIDIVLIKWMLKAMVKIVIDAYELGFAFKKIHENLFAYSLYSNRIILMDYSQLVRKGSIEISKSTAIEDLQTRSVIECIGSIKSIHELMLRVAYPKIRTKSPLELISKSLDGIEKYQRWFQMVHPWLLELCEDVLEFLFRLHKATNPNPEPIDRTNRHSIIRRYRGDPNYFDEQYFRNFYDGWKAYDFSKILTSLGFKIYLNSLLHLIDKMPSPTQDRIAEFTGTAEGGPYNKIFITMREHFFEEETNFMHDECVREARLQLVERHRYKFLSGRFEAKRKEAYESKHLEINQYKREALSYKGPFELGLEGAGDRVSSESDNGSSDENSGLSDIDFDSSEDEKEESNPADT